MLCTWVVWEYVLVTRGYGVAELGGTSLGVAFRRLLLALLLVLGTAQSPASAIFGGTSALGSPVVVSVRGPNFTCSGAPIASHLVVTAAHCVVSRGRPAAQVTVYAPGEDVSTAKSPAKVLSIFYPNGYYNGAVDVEPNDIAFLVIDRDFGDLEIDALATYGDVQAIVASGSSIRAYGYGARTWGGRSQAIPYTYVATPVPQDLYDSFEGFERTYVEVRVDQQGSTCAGDSGGPLVSEFGGKTYLLAVHSGTDGGPCSSPTTRSGRALGTIAGEYQMLLRQAQDFLRTIRPAAPTGLTLSNVGTRATARWTPASTVSSAQLRYQLVDAAQSTVCDTVEPTCQFTLSLGQNALRLYAVAGSMRSEPVALGVEVTIPAPQGVSLSNVGLQGVLAWTVPNGFEGVVTGYRVLDAQGREMCATSAVSCAVSVAIGENVFYIATDAGDFKGEAKRQSFTLRNAAMPPISRVQLVREDARVTWARDTDFANARPSQVMLSVRDGAAGALLCSARISDGGCTFRLEPRDYDINVTLVSDLGEGDTRSVETISGGASLDVIARVNNLALRITAAVTALLKSDPAYSTQLRRIQQQVPSLGAAYVYTAEAAQELEAVDAELAGLRARIKAQPKTLTITCVKGAQVQRVTARSPKCPAGFRRK